MYRYWTGTTWTAAVTSDPSSALPPAGPGQPSSFGPAGSYQTYQGGYQPSSGFQGMTGGQPAPAPQKKSPIGWIIGLVAVIVVVVLIAVFAIPRIMGGGSDPTVGPDQSNPTATICPTAGDGQTNSTNKLENGRLYGGAMSFAQLGSPWEPPHLDNRVPYGPPAYTQSILDQAGYDGNPNDSWVSSVVISDLWNGDGFGSVQQGAENLLTCVMGTFYGDTVVGQKDTTGKAHAVDGHDGWLISTTFTFNIPGLNATSEHVYLLVVDTGTASDGSETFSLFYSSVPNTSSQYDADVEKAMAGLTVDG